VHMHHLPSSPHLTMREEECNVSLSLAIGGVEDLPFIKSLDQTFDPEKRDGSGSGSGSGTRKKLRLSGEQLSLLEDSFRAHNTLAPDQKQELAQRLHLQPRQVEVWFQNRRARCCTCSLQPYLNHVMCLKVVVVVVMDMSLCDLSACRTKLKQTEVDCGFLRRCCERLANENRRLKRELMEMRSVVKPGSQLSGELRKAARLRMCSSCENMTGDEKKSSLLSTINSSAD
ncbi:hypothetical protein BHM03_00031441, partial [Ensete ventricosum]